MSKGWAIIGTGAVHAQMAPAIKEASDTRLVALLSRDKAKASAFARKHGIERVYDSLDALVHDPEVDVVYVASPNALHALHAVKAAEAGKHVFCEKPMALTPEDCRSIIQACERHGVKLGVDFMFRQHPAHVKARQLVAAGELGEVVLAKAHADLLRPKLPAWYYEPGMAGGGAVYRVGVHRFDLLRFILGCEVSEVSALIGEHLPGQPFEKFVAGMVRLDNGARGVLNFSLDIPHGTCGLELHGSRGSLFAVDTTSLDAAGGGELLLKTDAATTRYQFQKLNMYRAQVEQFNQCIREGGEPRASGVDGLRACEIALAMFESGQQGKTVRIRDLAGFSPSSPAS